MVFGIVMRIPGSFVGHLRLAAFAALAAACISPIASVWHRQPEQERFWISVVVTLMAWIAVAALARPSNVAAVRAFLYSCGNWWSDWDVLCWFN